MSWRQGKPEPQVVVAVARRVPVPVRRPCVPGVVVPAAAANHAVRALRQNPIFLYNMVAITFRVCGKTPAKERFYMPD